MIVESFAKNLIDINKICKDNRVDSERISDIKFYMIFENRICTCYIDSLNPMSVDFLMNTPNRYCFTKYAGSHILMNVNKFDVFLKKLEERGIFSSKIKLIDKHKNDFERKRLLKYKSLLPELYI